MNKFTGYSIYLLLFVLLLSGFASKLSVALNLPVNSDSALPALFFYDIVSEHNCFLSSWRMASTSYLFTDFPVYFSLGTVLGMSPFTAKLGAFLIFFSGVLFTAIAIFRVFGGREAILTAIAIFSVSLFSGNFLFRQFLHMGTIAYAFLGLFFVALTINGDADLKKSKKNIFNFIILSFLSTAGVFSDPYFIFIFTIPVISAYILLRLLNIRLLSGRKEAALFILLIASAAAGILLQKATALLGIHMLKLSETAPVGLTPLGSLGGNLYFCMQAVMALFDMDFIKKNLPLPEFIFRVLNFFLFLMVIAGSVHIIRKEKNGLKRFIILYFMILGTLLSLAFTLKTNVMDLNEARYLVPLLYGFSVLLALSVSGGYFKSGWYGSLILIVFAISSAHGIYKGFDFKPQQPHRMLAKYLEGENLTYGYSNYWNSGIVTLLSGNKVKVRPVTFWSKQGLMLPHYFGTKPQWYKPFDYTGPTFLMVSDISQDSGFSDFTPELIARMFGNPERILDFGDMTIYVWPYNIIKKVQSVEISEKTPHSIGNPEQTREGYVMHSRVGESGYLVYGRYWSLRKGKYKVNFYIQAGESPGEEAAIAGVFGIEKKTQRYTYNSVKAITSEESPRWKEYSIDLSVGENESANILYEFRVFSTGKGDVSVRGIYIE